MQKKKVTTMEVVTYVYLSCKDFHQSKHLDEDSIWMKHLSSSFYYPCFLSKIEKRIISINNKFRAPPPRHVVEDIIFLKLTPWISSRFCHDPMEFLFFCIKPLSPFGNVFFNINSDSQFRFRISQLMSCNKTKQACPDM